MSKIEVTKIGHFTGHKGAVFTLEEGNQKNLIYSGADDGYIVEWNIDTQKDGKLIINVPRPVYALKLDHKLNLLYCGSANGNLHVVDLSARKEIRNIEAHKLGLFDIQQTDHFIYTSGGDGFVRIWSKLDFQLIHAQKYSDKSARCIALNFAKQELAVGYSDHKIRIIDISDLTLIKTIDAHTNSVFTLAFDKKGEKLLSGGRDVMLKEWDVLNDYHNTNHLPAHNLHINHIAYAPGESGLMVSVSMDKTIKIWETKNLQLLKVIDKPRNDGHINSVNKILWINQDTLITGADDKQIMMWKLRYDIDAN